MKSTNFLVATIDKNFNMFKHIPDADTRISFIENIAEHIKRLEEISDTHHFYIDEIAFEALGRKNFPLRFTRVFSHNPERISLSTSYRVQHMNTMKKTIASKERFSPDTQIFFIGSSKFLLEASKYAKKLLLTVVDRAYEPNTTQIVDTFPIEDMQQIFFKRRSIHPEMLEQIKEYKEIVRKQKPKVSTTVLPNGMKMIEKNEDPIIDPDDEILNTPDYMFYEYSR